MIPYSAAPAAAAAASAGDDVFHKLPNPAKTSGGYTADEIAARRTEAYDRYKERKGPEQIIRAMICELLQNHRRRGVLLGPLDLVVVAPETNCIRPP